MTNNIYGIFGLGNPGKEYDINRHNAGFLFLDFFAKQFGFDCDFKKKKNFTFSNSNFYGKSVYLIKPQTYMNLSGNAVISAMNFYKIPKENIIIIYDDISLPFGSIRIRGKGSAGGHNGVKNIIQCLGGQEFNRIRIGVGAPKQSPTGEDVLKDYVLGNFANNQLQNLNEQVFPKIAEALPLLLDDNLQEAMNKFN